MTNMTKPKEIINFSFKEQPLLSLSTNNYLKYSMIPPLEYDDKVITYAKDALQNMSENYKQNIGKNTSWKNLFKNKFLELLT